MTITKITNEKRICICHKKILESEEQLKHIYRYSIIQENYIICYHEIIILFLVSNSPITTNITYYRPGRVIYLHKLISS